MILPNPEFHQGIIAEGRESIAFLGHVSSATQIILADNSKGTGIKRYHPLFIIKNKIKVGRRANKKRENVPIYALAVIYRYKRRFCADGDK